MGLETSGLSNEELTEKVSTFVDNLIGSGMGSYGICFQHYL